MKSILEKTIAVLLIIIFAVHTIFPCVIFAYTQAEITEQFKKETDEKINQKITEWLLGNGKKYENLTEQEKQELVDDLKHYIDFDLNIVLEEYRSYETIKNDDSIDKESLKYAIEKYVFDDNDVTYWIENYTEKNEPVEILPGISAPETWADFEIEVRKWLEDKLAEYSTNEEKLAYLISFVNTWRYELKDIINPEKLDPEECNEIVRRVVEEKMQAIEAYVLTEITADQARLLLINRLAELRVVQEKELEGLDKETKRLRLQEYFQDLKSKHIQATGEFYQETVAIAEKIRPVTDKADFLSNVPSYIEQFINDNLGETITILDIVFGMFSVTIDAVAGIFLYIPKVLFLIVPRSSNRNC